MSSIIIGLHQFVFRSYVSGNTSRCHNQTRQLQLYFYGSDRFQLLA